MTIADLMRPGRLLFAAGLTGLGVLSLVFGDLAPGLQPALMFVGDNPIVAYFAGGLLTFAALGLAGSRKLAVPAARMIAAFWVAWIVLGHSSALIAKPGDVTAWVSLSEAAAIAIVAWLLSRDLAGKPREGTRWTARMVVGLMLVWFGVVHLMFKGAIAGMIPGWMPAHDLWPWVTGAANIAAGLGVITGVLGRPAAALAGAMFASWIFLVHVPHLIAAPTDRAEWTAMALNLALIGVAWITAGAALGQPTAPLVPNP